jgi:hypothetical protein
MSSEFHKCKECRLFCDCDMDDKTCIMCSECQDNEYDRHEDIYDSPYDRLSEAEQQEHDQREAFNDRYQAWRNEY